MTAAIDTPGEAAAAKTCRNCGAAADGAYCPACGQETSLRLPTLREFIREAAGRYVAMDGRFWRTILALLTRPGFLTREYYAGRRRRYIRPARLYLFATLIFFAVSRAFVTPFDAADVRDDVDSSSKEQARDKGLNLELDDQEAIVPPWLQKPWKRFSSLTRQEKAEQLRERTLRYAPYAMFVLLPGFAFLLKLVYVGRRRKHPRRPRLYGEHLVHAAHDHAFVFIAATAMLLSPWRALSTAIGFAVAVYLLRSMRAVYGGSWLGVIVRAAILSTVYLILVSLAIAALVVLAILVR